MPSDLPTEIIERIATEAQIKSGILDLSGDQLAISERLVEIPKEVFDLEHLFSIDLSSNRLTLIPNEIRKLRNLIEIKISRNQFEVFPDILFAMERIQTLALSGNRLRSLPDKFDKFQALEDLNISDNALSTLPPSLGKLLKLRWLYIDGNPLGGIPEPVCRLTQLESLNAGTRGGEFQIPAAMKQIVNLKRLWLQGAGLSSLPSWFGDMGMLEELDLDSNLFQDIPTPIFSLTNLRYLSMGDIPLGEIDPRISSLTALTTLYLHSAKLATLPKEFASLEKLTTLGLWNNEFEEVPPVIFQLKNLLTLHLENVVSKGNHITRIPRELVFLPKLTNLYFDTDHVISPPPEIASKGLGAMREYFRQLDESGTDVLREAKLIIVGEAGAGKTSFVKKMLDPQYDLNKNEFSTEGIAITEWAFADDRFQQVTVHIWDFGGQEIYHSTHQFFLTQRSLYVLIADTRKEDTDFYYWLNIIELLSGASPVIVLKNEKFDRHRDIDDKQLRMRFSNLRSISGVNLATNRGLLDTSADIRHEILRLPHIGTILPKTWVEIRKTLIEHPSNTIQFTEYLQICQAHGIETLSVKMTLIEYLHDLGVCLHFRDDPLLKKILVLKPSWGTDAVYKVLDDRGVIERSGRFDRADLLSMWSEPEYEGMHDELLQLMLNFKICYAIPETSGAFIAPQRLSESRPQYEWRNDGNLILRYVYDFMPKGIVTQLIVAMHSFIAGSNCVWRNGVVIEKDDAFAEVIQTYAYSYKEIRVRTRGRNKKDLLTQVAYELEKIHRTYKELRYRTLIPCNCAACSIDVDPHFHSYDVLKKFSGDGEEYIQCQKSYKMVRVRSLIDDVQEITDSEEHRKRKDSTFKGSSRCPRLVNM